MGGAEPGPVRRNIARTLVALVTGAALLGACAGSPEEQDGRDDSFTGAGGKADAFGMDEDSPEAAGILAVANELTKSELDDDVGLSNSATKALVKYRAGDDGKLFTSDDLEIETLTELDDIPYIGKHSFRELFRYADEQGYIPELAAYVDGASRVIGIGDVHGDFDAAKRALRLAGVIDGRAKWIGGKTIVVQVGDVLDRGDGERQIIEMFDRLGREAEAVGGKFYWLLGNHEILNAEGDFDDVTKVGFSSFMDMLNIVDIDDRHREYSKSKRGRAAAFLPGGPYAVRLARHNIVMVVGDTVFVHGGLSKKHVEYGLERLNHDARDFLRWDINPTDIMDSDNGPLWTRDYGDEDLDCDDVDKMLDEVGASRIVIGHTVQDDGITSGCDEKVWRVDVGMTSVYGGPVEVVEIRGNTVTRLTE